MKIEKVMGTKKEYLDLLLLADEQEDMIDCYLEQGEMFVLNDDGIKADGVYELKNIAILPAYQNRGYGKSLIEFLFTQYPDCKIMHVGTGDCPSILSFYHACGLVESHIVKNFL